MVNKGEAIMKKLLSLFIMTLGVLCVLGSSYSYADLIKLDEKSVQNEIEAVIKDEDNVKRTYAVNYGLTKKLLEKYADSINSIKKDGNKDILDIIIDNRECEIVIGDNTFSIKNLIARVENIESYNSIINNENMVNNWVQYYVSVSQANVGVIASKHSEYVDLTDENVDYEFTHVVNVIKKFMGELLEDLSLFKKVGY